MNQPTPNIPVFNTDEYELTRKEDGTIVRIFPGDREEPEISAEAHRQNAADHQQIVVNSVAQAEKVEAFERDNPLLEVEAEEAPEQ